VTVAVLGVGAGGRGVAALCALGGHDVVACDWSDAIRRELVGGAIPYTGVAGEGTVRVEVTDRPADAAARAGLVLVATTAAGQRWALDAVAEADVPGQAVVVLSGLLGSLVRPDLRAGGRRLVGETSAFPLSARIVDGRCHIRRVSRPQLAALPAADGRALARRLGGVLEVGAAATVVEACLNNPNPLIHAGTMLLNLALVERQGFEAPAPLEGITPMGLRLIDALDAERLAIGAAYGYGLPPVDALYEALTGRRPPFRTPEGDVPQPLQARFLTEDVPYGLALWVSLAEAAGVRVPVMDALLRVYAAAAPALLRERRTLATLGLPQAGAGAVLATVEGGVHGQR
jgi:opine dehydrogenase